MTSVELRSPVVVQIRCAACGSRFRARVQASSRLAACPQGATRNMSVTLDAEQMPIRELLDKVVIERMKAAYVIRDGKVVITSRKAANKAGGAAE